LLTPYPPPPHSHTPTLPHPPRLVHNSGNFAGVLACSPANGVRINCIVTHSTGFVIGTDNGGVLLYDKSDTDGTQFSLMKTLNVLVEGITATSDKETSGERNVDPIVMACRVMNMTLSPTEDELVVTTSDHRMLKMNFTGLESLKETDCHFTDVTTSFHGPSPINDKDSSSSSVLFSSTANNANEEDDTGGVSIHTSAMVTGMDVCARKPLVATCGIDRYVRVWNYLTYKEEVKKMFPEEALSVAFHPSGLHVLVGFSDKLRLMNLLMDDIRVVTEFPIKACRECQFSAGGQVFAAANGHSIQLYRTYTAEPIALLRGHNSKVQSLHFTQHDTRLVSAGKDGAVYQWNITEGSIGDSKNKDSGSASSGMKREGEYVLKGCSYTHAIANIDGTLVYAVGSDSQIKEIEFQGNMTNATNPVSSDVGVMGQLAMPRSGRLLFTGTSKVNRPSMIMAMKVPLTGDTPPLPCLSGPVTRMCSAFDGSRIFVAGSDGCLIIYEVKEKDFAGKSLGAMSRDDTTGRPIYASEILVTRTDIEEQASAMREMQSKVDELHIHSEYQLRLKDMDANEKIKEVTEKFTQELEQDKNRYELLREEKNDMEMEFEEKIKHTEETHLHRLQQCEAEFQKQIMSEVERYQELVQEKDIQTQRWDQQQRDLIASHEQYTAEITEEYEQKLEEDRQARLHLAEERDELGRVYTETTKQLEEDIDTEIEELKKKYETKLNNEREATLRFKGENGKRYSNYFLFFCWTIVLIIFVFFSFFCRHYEEEI
jgi:WD40 repeat protein